MEILKFLTQRIDLDNDVIQIIQSEFVNHEFKKGEHILLPGNQNRRVYFIEKGLTRMYYCKEEKVITHMFFNQDQIFTNVEVIYYNEISPYGLECIEDCTLTSVSYDRIIGLAKTYPIIDELSRNILLETLYKLSNRLRSMQFKTAEERYNELLQQHPEILLRAPLGHIASYLGISQPTLSVIRSKK